MSAPPGFEATSGAGQRLANDCQWSYKRAGVSPLFQQVFPHPLLPPLHLINRLQQRRARTPRTLIPQGAEIWHGHFLQRRRGRKNAPKGVNVAWAKSSNCLNMGCTSPASHCGSLGNRSTKAASSWPERSTAQRIRSLLMAARLRLETLL